MRFEDREVGTRDERDVTIRNTGSGDLDLGTPWIAGDDSDDFWVAGGTCTLPATLDPGETCAVRVAFAPSAAGERAARLEVPGTRDGESSVHSVALSGAGTARPAPVKPRPAPVTPAPVAPAAPAPAAPAAPAGLVPAGSGAVLGATAQSSRASVRSLTVRSRVARARVRVEGLRVVLRIAGDANVVRVRVYRMRGTRKDALVAQAYTSAASNPVRLRLSDRTLRRRLAPGRYRVEVAAGMTRRTLGAVTVTTLRVVR